MYITLRADDEDKLEAVISAPGALNDIKGLNFHNAEVAFVTEED